MRAFAVFKSDDFPNREKRFDLDTLKRDLFKAGLHLFFAAILVVTGTVLKLGNDQLMSPNLSGELLTPFFVVGYIGNLAVFILVAGFFRQTFLGVVTLLNALDSLVEELTRLSLVQLAI